MFNVSSVTVHTLYFDNTFPAPSRELKMTVAVITFVFGIILVTVDAGVAFVMLHVRSFDSCEHGAGRAATRGCSSMVRRPSVCADREVERSISRRFVSATSHIEFHRGTKRRVLVAEHEVFSERGLANITERALQFRILKNSAFALLYMNSVVCECFNLTACVVFIAPVIGL